MKRGIFSLLYSDCFPSVLPHWPQCRCCRRRLRWECHKWPETNVGLSHPADLQHSRKTFHFFSFLLFCFNLSLSPILPFPSTVLPAIQFLQKKGSNSCYLPWYPFNSSCFSTSSFPLHLHLSCQIIWQRKLWSIFHLNTMVNQCHQSCTTWSSSWLKRTRQGKYGLQ